MAHPLFPPQICSQRKPDRKPSGHLAISETVAFEHDMSGFQFQNYLKRLIHIQLQIFPLICFTNHMMCGIAQ